MKYIKLSEACDFQGGSQPPKDEWTFDLKDGYVRMLQIRDFTQSGKTVPEYVKFTNRLKMCCEEDILIARYGASLGKILTGLAGAYNVAIIKAIPDLRILEKRFLYYYLKSPVFQTALFNVGVRAAQAGFNKEDLRELLIPDISKDKQLEIVSTLERIERILLLKQKQSQILDNLIKARFVEMFGERGKRVPLKDYVFFQEGPGVRSVDFTADGMILLTGSNINDNRISFGYKSDRFISCELANTRYSHFICDIDDILVVSSAIDPSKFDKKVAIVKEDKKYCLNTGIIRFKPNRKYLTLGYLREFLKTDYFKHQVMKEMRGIAQMHFGPSHLKEMIILLPESLEEQKDFEVFLSQVDKSKVMKRLRLAHFLFVDR